jgi:hypothetical protein
VEEEQLSRIKDGRWFLRSVNRLRRFNHSLAEIGEYTLDQFFWHLDAVEQVEARERLQTIADMQLCISSALVEDSGLQEHLDDLRLAARGA